MKTILIAVVLIGFVFLAGCTNATGKVTGVSNETSPPSDIIPNTTNKNTQGILQKILRPKVSTKDPSEMVLKLEDLPVGFSVNESRYRTTEDISADAKEHGWKTGYGVVFEMMEEFTAIRNYNSVYPIENITFPLEQTRSLIANNSNMSYISAPKIGDESIAYKEVYLDFIIPIVKYTIEFRKHDVYEVISVGGIGGKVSANDTVKYAELIENRIN